MTWWRVIGSNLPERRLWQIPGCPTVRELNAANTRQGGVGALRISTARQKSEMRTSVQQHARRRKNSDRVYNVLRNAISACLSSSDNFSPNSCPRIGPGPRW